MRKTKRYEISNIPSVAVPEKNCEKKKLFTITNCNELWGGGRAYTCERQNFVIPTIPLVHENYV